MRILKTLWHQLPNGFRGFISQKHSDICFAHTINSYLKSADSDNPEMFESIEVETINRCNGKCSFCPVNVNEPQREYAKMKYELFDKIVSELEEMNYSRRICLFANNEPFLDERIIDWNIELRHRLPLANIFLYTNGSLLNVEKIEKIYPAIDRIIIDNYDDEELPENLKQISMWKKENDREGKIQIADRKRDEILTSRGGQAPNKKGVKTIKEKCYLPWKQLIIRPDGRVSLCNNDALGKYTLGNLNENSMQEIWRGNAYRKIREEMKKNGRKNLMLCKHCDSKLIMRKRV